jgi:hypothetical protein
MTPESRVKAEIRERLAQLKKIRPIYWHAPVQNGMGAPTLDFIGCCSGRYFAIEAKAPGMPVTERQRKTMGEIEVAGGISFVVRNSLDLDMFERWARS